MSYYDTLGVEQSASQAEIKKAYQRLAKRFHPDKHPEASGEERARYEQAMASINEAYATLKSPEHRSAYDTRLRVEADDERLRPPRTDECSFCGYGPARLFSFEHQHGWILGRTRYTNETPLCRECALAVGRSQQDRTLKTGWWGVIAFFANFAVIWRNARTLKAAARLPRPTRRPDVIAPLAAPLNPEPTLAQRGGVYLASLLVIVLAAVGAVSAQENEAKSNFEPDPSSPAANDLAPTWKSAGCVLMSGTTAEPAYCFEGHNGRIVDRVESSRACPYHTSRYVDTGDAVLCIFHQR